MIKRIKWKDHPTLGNLELDFTKDGGKNIFNTIIFVGENGCGKTSILESINNFLNHGSIVYFDYIDYKIIEKNKSFKVINNAPFKEASIGHYERIDEDDGKSRDVFYLNKDKYSIYADFDEIRRYGCFYSKARSGFITNKITTTTTLQLDLTKNEDDRDNDFTHIKQLLIDIDSQDNEFIKNELTNNGSLIYKNIEDKLKMYRFKNAFDNFFDNKLSFLKVNLESSYEKEILFSKNNKKYCDRQFKHRRETDCI